VSQTIFKSSFFFTQFKVTDSASAKKKKTKKRDNFLPLYCCQLRHFFLEKIFLEDQKSNKPKNLRKSKKQNKKNLRTRTLKKKKKGHRTTVAYFA